MNGRNGVSGQSRADIRVELFDVHQGHGLEYQSKECCCSEGQCQLLISEDRMEIVRVNGGIVAIPLFWVDVPSSSQSVGFCSEFSGAETDDQVELRK